jgi:hypothetical protein
MEHLIIYISDEQLKEIALCVTQLGECPKQKNSMSVKRALKRLGTV